MARKDYQATLAYNRLYYETHKEKVKETRKKYYARKKFTLQAYQRNYVRVRRAQAKGILPLYVGPKRRTKPVTQPSNEVIQEKVRTLFWDGD